MTTSGIQRIIVSACVILTGGLTAVAQDSDTKTEIRELRALVEKLQSRVAELESRVGASQSSAAPLVAAESQPVAAPSPGLAPAKDILGGTTFNFMLDGYYSYNTNSPIGRVNLLRAYDVSSNAFSLNQATVVMENAPDPANGKRYGARVDLQFGQATQTLQGNAANEPRPAIYRNIFQAYGTYVFPLKAGWTVDVGKWASALGIENNYTKDQINYSRSYWFNFLPFYHMGVRSNLALNDKLTLSYWLVNGTQQSEPFNGYKDQLFGFTLTPRKTLSWTVNYYLGQEHPDVQYFNGAAPPNLPEIQGVPFQPIRPAPNGKLHIFDTYATWQASKNLTLALEGDYVIQRLLTNTAPAHAMGGAAYGRYQMGPKWALGGRAEYLSDRGGLFSGTTQALKETTFTVDYKIADGFLVREEWRRDFSNRPYFLTDTLGVLKKEQNTIGVGLVWWFGRKEGAW